METSSQTQQPNPHTDDELIMNIDFGLWAGDRVPNVTPINALAKKSATSNEPSNIMELFRQTPLAKSHPQSIRDTELCMAESNVVISINRNLTGVVCGAIWGRMENPDGKLIVQRGDVTAKTNCLINDCITADDSHFLDLAHQDETVDVLLTCFMDIMLRWEVPTVRISRNPKQNKEALARLLRIVADQKKSDTSLYYETLDETSGEAAAAMLGLTRRSHQERERG